MSLKPFNILAVIVNQANPALNSLALLVLCVSSNDGNLNRALTDGHSGGGCCCGCCYSEIREVGSDADDRKRKGRFCIFEFLRSFLLRKQSQGAENSCKNTGGGQELECSGGPVASDERY